MKKIIVTDALRDFVEHNVRLFTGPGYKTFFVKSGEEALDVHRKERADLIIIEPDFHDLTCEQLCSVIRGDDVLKRVSTLVVCSDKLSEIERCQRCGANDYIQPLTPTIFLRKATRLLNISERTSYRVIVKVSRKEGGEASHFFCSSQNISGSGILLETDRVLSKGDNVTCSFFLPNSVRIVSQGEVVRIAEREDGSRDYGVKFVNMSPLVQSRVASFIGNWEERKKRYD
jgi:DNA-binding response OmpR family regulator